MELRKDIWEHIGGGCSVDHSNKSKYLCDDIYENQQTKKTVIVFSTMETHFKMPEAINSIEELLKLEGTSLKK